MNYEKRPQNNGATAWSVQEMELLHNLKSGGTSYPKIAEIMSKTKTSSRTYNGNLCQKKFGQTDWNSFFKDEEDIEQQISDINDTEIEKDKIVEKTLENHERLVKRENARTELIIDALKSAIYRLPKPKMSDLRYIPRNKKQYSSEEVGVIVSDLHIGGCYTLEDTGGLAEYNLDVFMKRLETLKESVLEIIERHRNMHDLPVLHIFTLGDIVAGMNDAGQWSSSYIDMEIYDQMMEGVNALRDVITAWSGAFEKVIFYGVYGNHGRCGRRGVQKNYTNWDRICYDILHLSLKEYKNIEWNIPKAWFIQTKILNHKFYLVHGDGIRGQMGIPYYGVEKAQSNISGIMRDFPDYILMGHFHTSAEIQTTGSRIIMNGSFFGGDMYSIRDLRRCDAPEQKIFGIHPKKGITWKYDIRLDCKG